jgi:FkbM family methyltransferase
MRLWLAARLRSLLARRGLQLRRVPSSLARSREAELRLRLEHVVAHHLVHHQPTDFFFIQVGAFDGVANDPLHDLIVRFQWRGVLLEPQPEAFQALTATYRGQPQLSLVNAAIADRSGFRPLYKLRRGAPGLPSWAPQVASFRRETVVKHGDVIRGIEDLVESELVPCISFDDLPLPGAATTIDLLQIDAEGSDFEVIQWFHASGRKAHIVAFEHKHLSRREHADCVTFLIERGYSVGLDAGDSIAYLGGGAGAAAGGRQRP